MVEMEIIEKDFENKVRYSFIGLEKILKEESEIIKPVSNDNHFVESDILYQHPSPRNIKTFEYNNMKLKVMDKHNFYIENDFSDLATEEQDENVITHFYKYISEMLH